MIRKISNNRVFKAFLVFCMAFSLGFATPILASPLKVNFGDLLKDAAKTAGIAALIRGASDELNNFVNGLLSNNKAATRDMTKVVPILSIDRKVAVGAAQVAGSKELLDKVRAVVMLQADYQGKFRIKAYIPADSSNPLSFARVNGVGISAVIDVTL